MTNETFTDRTLTLEVRVDDAVYVVWRGKSTAREPGQFILPILTQAIEVATSQGKRVVMDFRDLEYMNSSTVTPLIRVLDQAKTGTAQLKLLYCKQTKWQALNFTALEVFHTKDERIQIQGL